MKNLFFLAIISFVSFHAYSQNVNKEDSLIIKKIYDTALLEGKSYDWLDYLSNQIGGRLSGSLQAEKAVRYTETELKELGLDKVWLQPVMVPKWTRGAKEYAYIETAPGETSTTNICALGGSVSTPLGGLKAQVIEVTSLDEIEKLGEEKFKREDCFL